MRRALFAVTLVALVCASDRSALPHEAPGSVKLTVLGDSLALGVGASDSANGFAFLLYKRIAEQRPGSSVTNLAISGATTQDVLRLEAPRVAASQPAVVLIVAGANDVVHLRTRAAFARDYAALVDAVRRAAPHASIVLFNVPDLALSPIFDPRAQAAYGQLARADNTEIAAIATRTGARVVDFFGLTQRDAKDTLRFLSSDQFHPSDDGHAAIARDVWPEVERALPL